MKTTPKPTVKRRNAASHRAHVVRPAARRLGLHAQTVVKDVQEIGGIATDFAQQNLERLHDRATECYEDGRVKVLDVQRTVQQYIQEQPVKSVLIAAGVGLLFGRFWLHR